MKKGTIFIFIMVIFTVGCSNTKNYLKKLSPFQEEEPSLEPKEGAAPPEKEEFEKIFVCAGDINVTYKKLGQVSLGEYGFSDHSVLARKIKQKALLVGAHAVINVQYDTGYANPRRAYGNPGDMDYGVGKTSWSKGTAVELLESYNPLGIIVCSLTKENKEWFGFKSSQNGVLVVRVKEGSTAANAGIRTEDLLMEWNGEKITSKKQFHMLIKTTTGEEAEIIILRNDEIEKITLFVPARQTQQYITTKVPAPVQQQETAPPQVTHNAPPPQTSQSVEKSADVYNEIGDLYLRKGMYRDAMEEYKKAVEADPYNAISHFNLSIVYDKLGMKNSADEEFAIYKKLKSR